jgi:hypothetical protein
LLAEDCQVLAFAGSPQNAEWLDGEQPNSCCMPRRMQTSQPTRPADFIRRVIDGFDFLSPHLESVAIQRGQELLDAHQRVRRASKIRNVRYRVEPQLPPDVLGIYVYSSTNTHPLTSRPNNELYQGLEGRCSPSKEAGKDRQGI